LFRLLLRFLGFCSLNGCLHGIVSGLCSRFSRGFSRRALGFPGRSLSLQTFLTRFKPRA
jgi:hypothetical protein